MFEEGKWTLPPQEDDSEEEFDFSNPNPSDEESGLETEEEVTDK